MSERATGPRRCAKCGHAWPKGQPCPGCGRLEPRTLKLTQLDIPRLDEGEYRDSEIRGLLFRVRDTGLRSFELRYTVPTSGKRRRLTIGESSVMSLADARTLSKRLIAGVWTGGNPARELRRTGGITIGDLGRRFLASAKLADSTRKDWTRMLNVDLAPVSQREAATFRRAEIAELGATIAERSGWVANRVFEMLRRFYSFGVEKGHLDASPFVMLAPPWDGETKSMRSLSPDELRALLASLDHIANGTWKGKRKRRLTKYVDQVELLLLTGVRLESGLEARRGQFHRISHPEVAEWRVPPEYQKLREKKRAQAKAHVVPLSRQAVAVVQRRVEAAEGAEVLFPRTYPSRGKGKPTAWWSTTFVRRLHAEMDSRLPAPAQRWTIHNLRHTITTNMEDILGVSPAVTDAILGHRAVGSEAHAVYSQAEHMKARREALQNWGDWLDSLRWAPMRKGDAG